MNPKNVRTILFDYDGTLHDSMKIFPKAFNKAYQYLVDNNYAKPHNYTYNEIKHFLGVTPRQMLNAFGDNIPESVKDKAHHILKTTLFNSIKNHEAELFDWTIDVLKTLKGRGYQLGFISNCENYYMHAHTHLFKLGKYFDYMVCSESYSNTHEKEDVLEKLKPNLIKDIVIVGDRSHDIIAGKKNNVYTIGALYGYAKENELKDADLTIENLVELLDIFEGPKP